LQEHPLRHPAWPGDGTLSLQNTGRLSDTVARLG